MPYELDSVRILIFVGADYEDLELQYPKYRLREAGAEVIIAGLEPAGTKYLGKHGYPQVSDACVDDLDAADFTGVVVPGGWMPDKLRRSAKVKSLVSDFEKQGKLIASICHGPWIDISANVVKGYTYTSTPALTDDLTNAGATWVDEETHVDRNHVSARRPDDLPAFCRAMIEVLKTQQTR